MVKKRTKKGLVKKTDDAYSLYIRHRDGQERPDGWWSCCVTCGQWKPLKAMTAGHFQSRRHYSTRWDDKNVAAQCVKCNMFNQGEQYRFGQEIDSRWGEGTAAGLVLLSHQTRKITTEELEQIVDECNAYVKRLNA